MFFFRVVIFLVFVVGYVVHWALNPEWGYRRVFEGVLIVCGLILVYLIIKGAEEAYPQQDEPNDISPADRVRKIKGDSDDQTKHSPNH